MVLVMTWRTLIGLEQDEHRGVSVCRVVDSVIQSGGGNGDLAEQQRGESKLGEVSFGDGAEMRSGFAEVGVFRTLSLLR